MWNFAVVLLLWCLCFQRIKTELNPSISVCSTSDLNKQMCNIMNKDITPCEDFNRFTCGKYIDKRNFNYFASLSSDLERLNTMHIKSLVKDLANNQVHAQPFELNLVIDLYKSCMTRGEQGVKPMMKLIRDYGGWPIVNGQDWRESNWVELNITKRILNEGYNIEPILKMTYNNASNELLLDLPTFVAEKKQILDTGFPGQRYHELMVRVSMRFGANAENAHYGLGQALSFERSLAKHSDQNTTFDSITIHGMQSQYPELLKFIRPLIPSNVRKHTELNIILKPLQYFESLESTLKNTSNRTIANYLIWRAVVAAAEFLDTDLHHQIMVGLDEVNSGSPNTWEPIQLPINGDECFDYVSELLPVALDSIYIKQNVELISSSKEAILDLIKNIKNEFIKMVDESVWLDSDAKANLICRLKSIVFFIGHSPFNIQLKELSEYNLELHSDNFLLNVLHIRQYRNQVKNRELPPLPAWKVNAKYSPIENRIYVPPGVLRWPYFKIDAPSYFNYGALGYVIGHEIGHAIDVNSRKLDTQGNSFDWIDSTENEFNDKVDCFKRQFSRMETDTGIRFNASKTYNEDIADNLGMKAAYRAYIQLPAANERGLLNYSHRQLFWISMAQTKCSFIDPSDYASMINRSMHTLDPYRILGMVQNMPDFTEDFSCYPNSRMYFEENKICKLW